MRELRKRLDEKQQWSGRTDENQRPSEISPLDLQIVINKLKIDLDEQAKAATRYRNERNTLIKVIQKQRGLPPVKKD